MIVVTGAAGKTGRAVIQTLVKNGQAVKAFVYRKEYAPAMRDLGVSTVFVGNLLNPAEVSSALEGVRTVYHICPNMHPRELEIGKTMIEALQGSRCRRIVYHSVLHPQTEAMPHHWQKLRVEEMLFESGLDYTILQPCAYMQNIFKDMDRILSDGFYTVPYNPSAKFNFVNLEDIAEVAMKVVQSPDYKGGIYELSGPEALSVQEVAEMIGELSGRQIEVVYQSPEEWRNQPGAAALPEYKRTCLYRMFRYYDKNGLTGNGKVLKWLLNRKPATVREVLSGIWG